MKNLFIAPLLLVAAIFATSCNHNGRATAKRTLIDGKITNLQELPNTREFTLSVMDFGGNPTTYKGTVRKDGTFKIYFDQYIAQDVLLTPIVQTFIAHPGDSIHIDIDFKSIGNVSFSGDAEDTNNDLYHYINEYYAHYDDSQVEQYFRALDTVNFKVVCDNMKAELLKNRKDFITKYQPNDEVKKWTENYINVSYYGALLNFSNMYTFQSLRDPRVVPARLGDYRVTDGELNEIYNTNLLNADSYKMLRDLMPRVKTNNRIKVSIPLIEESNHSALIKQLLVGRFFYNMLTMNNADYFDKNRKLFDDDIQAPFIKQPLIKYYTTVKKNQANSKISSDAILKTAASAAGAKEIMDSIKNQNKGKVIYVDFWATWCGPCKAELPFSKKLIEKYKGKNIAFAFVCLSSPKDTWKANLSDLKLGGVQYFCDAQQSEDIKRGLNIRSIPFYMMINKNGDIAEEGDGIRPHDPLTEQKIVKLLN